ERDVGHDARPVSADTVGRACATVLDAAQRTECRLQDVVGARVASARDESHAACAVLGLPIHARSMVAAMSPVRLPARDCSARATRARDTAPSAGRGSELRLELVALTPYRQEVTRRAGIGLEVATQPHDEVVDHAAAGVVAQLPDLLLQLF